jgi:hypothetical protein
LADSVANTTFLAAKVSPYINVHTFKNRPSSLEMHVPFHGFKPIIQEMLAKIDVVLYIQNNASASTSANGIKETSLLKMKMTMSETILNGLSIVFTSLPANMQGWRPLLSSAQIITDEEDNDETKLFVGQQRVQYTIDLLVAMINAFPVITKATILLRM